jgi:hypothetical protein
MQSLSTFIMESQTANRRLLKMFDLLDDCESELERNWGGSVVKNDGSFNPSRADAIGFEVVGTNRALLQ